MDMVHKDIDVLLGHLKSDGVDKELKSELMCMRTIFKFQHFIFSGYLRDTITEKIFEECIFYSPSCRTSKECMVKYVDSLVSFMIHKGRHTSMDSLLKDLQSIKKATRRCLSNSTLVPSEVLEEKLRVLIDSLHVKASTAQQEDLLIRIQALADTAADLCFSFWVKTSDHFLDAYEISHLLYLRNICKERVLPLEIKDASQMVLLDVCKRLELVKGLLMNLPKQYLKQDKIKHLLRQVVALTSKTRYSSLEQDMAIRVNDELHILLENSKDICLDIRQLLHSGFPLTNDWGMIDSLVMSLNERLNLKADFVNKHEVEKVIAVVKQGRKFGSLDKLRERIFKTAYEADYVIDSMNLDNDPPPYLESYLSDIIMESTIIHDEIFDIGFLNVVKSDEAVESSNPLSFLVNTPTDDNVLGFKEEEAIKEHLLSGLRKLDVITILGVSGLGKTTLANKIYNDQNVINHFQVRAWCFVSQEYNKTKLLCEIYSQVTEDELTEEMQRLIKENRKAKVTEVDLAEKFSKYVMDKNTRRKVTETDVAEKLHNFLKEKKYLIVLDDIWESRACDEIIRCFPTEENGSRIMLTTRFDEVAHEIKLHSDPHYLPLFTTEESWELLQWKLLQNERCYPELLEIGKEISQSCRGLPLFIVLVAGLLSSIQKEERLWSEVAETLSSVASEHKMHMRILGLVYKHLPDHLKSCLLFFAAFPDDQEIAVSKLVQLWAAEGFVGKIERKSLEDAAEDYLNNLLSAGLIIVSKRRYDGSIISCRVHNSIHEFCSEKAKKERFLMIPNTNNQIPMWDLACHRICFNHQDIECHNPFFSWLQWSRSVRTILCTSRGRDPHLSKAIDFSQISHMSRLIRVLDLESITVGNTFFSVIECLPHLRFIAVHTGYFNFVFPSSLGNLQNLETLKIKTENQCIVLPKIISSMVKLRQLDITDSFQFGIDEDDSCLKNIQALSTVVLSNKQSIDVMTRFPLLQRLKCIYIGSNESSPESYEFLELEKIYQLEYLHISYDGSLERRDLIDFKFPWSLKKLVLNGFSLPAYEICKVALIPTLVSLKLQNVHFKDHQWDVEEYDFPKLNYLKLHNCSIVYWSALTSCFPCLKRLILSRCIILKEVPSCFGNIATLEAVEVYRCNSSLEDSVLKIQSEATNRSSPLMVRILKSENLQIFYSLDPKKSSAGVSRLPENVVHKTKDMEPTIVCGSGTETSQLLVVPVSGKGEKKGEKNQVLSYMAERVVATGSFAVVFQAKCLETGETVAIKKVLQDRRYKNRELQIMRMLEHPNLVQLKHCFFSTTEKDELYLNLVLEYVPETLYRVSRHYSKANQHMPLIYVQLYTYQICRALNYIHNVFGVCHRDIKPQNLLVNPLTHQLKICDFGSAKMLVPGEPNISYICCRFYRAPELIFGATDYTTKIDVWSVGCVMAELLLGHPLFPGESSVDQLVKIIKILGTPTMEEIKSMNPNHTDFKFPQIKANPWHKVFQKRMPLEAVDLVSRLLQYSPSLRCTTLEACAHPFFDALRDPNACLPNGRPLPPLFNFTPQELSGAPAELRNCLIPKHARK